MHLHGKEVLHNSCNTGTRGLPDMSTLSPQASGVHIRQIPLAHVIAKQQGYARTYIYSIPVHYSR